MFQRTAGWILFAATLVAAFTAYSGEVDPQYIEQEAGVSYAHVKVDAVPWSIHVARFDRSTEHLRLNTALAGLRVYGLSPISAIAQYAGISTGTRPVAAINGDWFYMQPGNYQGLPRGIQIVEGELIRNPMPQFASFWLDAEGSPQLGNVTSQLALTWPDGSQSRFTLNDDRKDNAIVLYTPAMGLHQRDRRAYTQTTRTVGGREILLAPVDADAFPTIGPGAEITAKVEAIREEGNSPLRANRLVLSAGPEILADAPAVNVGDELLLSFATSPDITGATAAIGAGTILVRDGRQMITTENPNDARHPRTAFGWNDTHYFFVVVDGRQPELSVGMRYYEISSLMHQLGCTHALEMDGGGSSTLWLRGTVMNSPSDWGTQRPVANAIIIFSSEHDEDK